MAQQRVDMSKLKLDDVRAYDNLELQEIKKGSFRTPAVGQAQTPELEDDIGIGTIDKLK